MEFQPSLFAPEPLRKKQSLAQRIEALKQRNIFIGTSSWRYEGWLGQIYTLERYFTRGRFSKAKFHSECIHEYAEVFPVVGGDFSYYAIPEPAFWNKLFANAPPDLKWSLKLPMDFTARRFSHHAGARAGLINPAFLDAEMFESGFLEPLLPHLDRIAVLMAEFTSFSKSDYSEPGAFIEDLNGFLERIPKTIRFAVELRNSDYLDAEYFSVLQHHGVAHIFNSWTRMPRLQDQLLIEDAFTAPFSVARALLRPTLGGLAGLLGAVLGSAATALILNRTAGIPVWTFDLYAILVTIVGSAVLTAAVALLGSMTLFTPKPLEILRRQ